MVDGAKRGTLGRPLDEIRAGRFNDVPVVMGSVQDEGTIFLPEMPFIAGVLCKDRRPLAQRGVRPEARIPYMTHPYHALLVCMAATPTAPRTFDNA